MSWRREDLPLLCGIFVAFVLVFTTQTEAACGDTFSEVLSSCCPSKYTSLCCAGLTNTCNATEKSTGVLIEPSLLSQNAMYKPYCLQPWNSSACEAGFYFDPVSKSGKPCPNGYYCSINTLCLIPCPVGAYCVQETLVNITDSSPDLCKLAGVCCSSNSTPVHDAVNGYQCPGAATLVACPKGSYCPDVTSRITCPEGHQCREGSTEAEPCPALVICPEGAESPIYGVGALLLILALVLLFLLLLYLFNHLEDFRYFVRRLRERRQLGTTKGHVNSVFSVADGIRFALERAFVVEEPHELIEAKKYTIDIEFKDLSLTLKRGGLKVLKAVSGKMMSGELTAILGPSGSGKTTLLNTLSGKAYYGTREGHVVINGSEVSNLDTFKTVTAFVPQEDIMHRTLTVRETLRYQAELRLPGSISREEKEEKTQRVINLMKLRRVADTIIGDEETRGISGGQRKRVNIGMELVCEPTLLFLDEPTSGLDSSSSLMVVDSLKTVAEHGRLTVVCIIHQPRYEIFSQFHKVLFLGIGGQTVFQGTVDEAESYFSGLGLVKPPNVNPADFYMDLIDGTMKNTDLKPTDLFVKWNQYRIAKSDTEFVKVLDIDDGDDIVTEREDFKPRKRPHVFKQFWAFLRREVRLQFRIIRTLFLDQFLVILAGGILGAVRRNATLREFYPIGTLTSLCLAIIAMLSASRCFGLYRPVFWREASSGVNRLSYFLAVIVVQIPIILITPLSFLSLMFALVAPRGHFMDFYVVVLGLQFASTGSGYMLSTIFNPKSSQIASVVFAFINAVLAGDAIWLCDLDNYTVIGPIFYNLSFSRWYLEGLMEKEALEYPRVLAPYVHHTINENGFTLNNFPVIIGALIGIGVGYRFIAFICLIFINRKKQV